jgi:hypothetical protein
MSTPTTTQNQNHEHKLAVACRHLLWVGGDQTTVVAFPPDADGCRVYICERCFRRPPEETLRVSNLRTVCEEVRPRCITADDLRGATECMSTPTQKATNQETPP